MDTPVRILGCASSAQTFLPVALSLRSSDTPIMTHYLPESEPLHESAPETTVIATDDGTYYRVLNIEPGVYSESLETDRGERVTVKNIRTSDTQTFVYPDTDPFNTPTAQIIPENVVAHPEHVLYDYTKHHLSKDLSVLGRRHEHTVGGSIGIIEYAIHAATTDNFPATTTD